MTSRLDEDDRTLRTLPFRTSLPGDKSDDYDEMRVLFLDLAEFMRSIKSDPNAIKSQFGGYDVGMIRAITAMSTECRKAIEAINKMKNSDRLTLAILETHTKSMAQNLAIPLGEKIRLAMLMIEQGNPDQAQGLLGSMLSSQIVDLFRNAAMQAMTTSKEAYHLN